MPRGTVKWNEPVGSVSLICYEQGTDSNGKQKLGYYARYWDQDRGRSVEVSLKAKNRDDARSKAKHKAQEVADLRAMPKSARQHIEQAPTIVQAITEAIEARNRRRKLADSQLLYLERVTGYWTDFMKSSYPAVKLWKDVRRTPHISSYVQQLQKRKLSPVSIKHYLEPLSITSGYFADDYAEFGYRDIKPLKAAPVIEDKPKKNYLAPEQVEKAIDTALHVEQWKVALTLYMGCYCGLNLREIVWLREQDFDLKGKIVTVTRAKNEYRPRTIPVPGFVAEFVQQYISRQPVRDMAGYLVPPPEGKEPNDGYVSRALVRVLKHAKLDGIIAPKDCRKTFENMPCLVVAPEWLLDSYMGRVGDSPHRISRLHYRDPSLYWQAEIVKRVEEFRDKLRTQLRTGGTLEVAEG